MFASSQMLDSFNNFNFGTRKGKRIKNGRKIEEK